ncbi:MAG: hypothetical protein IBX52_10755 [Bacterioplanes sp.]|nr:hypothetical protein [Bacterioplanes sp.]
MNKQIITRLVAASVLTAASVTAVASEPSRGFMVERGNVAENGVASIDLASSGAYSSGAVRLGLPTGELILNSQKAGDLTTTEGVFKYALPSFEGLSELQHNSAIYGGLSIVDLGGVSYNNLMLGAAFSANVESLTFSVSPELVVDDLADDTYLNLGLGAYVNLPETSYGRFQPGAELGVSTADDASTTLSLGARWMYNERLTLDVVMFRFGDDTNVTLPGLLRINARF